MAQPPKASSEPLQGNCWRAELVGGQNKEEKAPEVVHRALCHPFSCPTPSPSALPGLRGAPAGTPAPEGRERKRFEVSRCRWHSLRRRRRAETP